MNGGHEMSGELLNHCVMINRDCVMLQLLNQCIWEALVHWNLTMSIKEQLSQESFNKCVSLVMTEAYWTMDKLGI